MSVIHRSLTNDSIELKSKSCSCRFNTQYIIYLTDIIANC